MSPERRAAGSAGEEVAGNDAQVQRRQRLEKLYLELQLLDSSSAD